MEKEVYQIPLTCEHCKFWKGDEGLSKYKRCLLPNKRPDLVLRSACGFRTSKNFGCNQFQPKNIPDVS